MKFRTAVVLLLLVTSVPLTAQRWEVGLSAGISYYVGDLNPTLHFRFPYPAGSVFAKRNFDKHWSVRAGFTYAHVGADDDVGIFGYQQVRNLRFESDIFEVHAAVEFNFFPYIPGNDEYKKWTPYLFLGVSGYYFDPYTYVNGSRIPLQPLGTEGQGTPSQNFRPKYSLFQPAIPFGIGFKWNVAKRFSLGLEYGMRILFTDYLDDASNIYGKNGEILIYNGAIASQLSDESRGIWSTYSNDDYQRGIRTDNDWWGYVGITFMYNIKDPTTCPGYKVKHTWKPRRRR